MGIIQELPERLVHQIAAGEVVERPYSVVKELVENAIDAHAGKISVDVVEGGTESIIVSDDGIGMDPEDALLCLRNHATSKIETTNELFRIGSLGFRGEAMPSIASVSKFSIQTRTAGCDLGSEVTVDTKGHCERRPMNTPKGTIVRVHSLFYNVPARLKFLKKPKTEMGHIVDFMAQTALCYPHIHFSLKHNLKLNQGFPAAESSLQRIQQIFGVKTSRNLFDISFQGDGFSFNGYIGSPDLARGNNKSQYVFVNGRFVKDATINHAITRAYETIIPKGAYPFVVLFFQFDPEHIDVNVHPAKREIRLAHAQSVYQAVQHCLLAKLQTTPWLDQSYLRQPATQTQKLPPSTLKNQSVTLSRDAIVRHASGGTYIGKRGMSLQIPAAMFSQDPGSRPPHDNDNSPPVCADFQQTLPLPADDVPFRIIGQFGKCYLFIEYQDMLILIDQHAFHERLRFDTLMMQHRKGRIEKQVLLFPEVVDFAPGERDCIETLQQDLAGVGFDIEPFGGHSIVLKAMPQILADFPAQQTLDAMLNEMRACGGKIEIESYISKLIATLACHSAVRGGEILTELQIRTLLKQVDGNRYTATCPHGRSAVRILKRSDVEKMFDRH